MHLPPIGVMGKAEAGSEETHLCPLTTLCLCLPPYTCPFCCLPLHDCTCLLHHYPCAPCLGLPTQFLLPLPPASPCNLACPSHPVFTTPVTFCCSSAPLGQSAAVQPQPSPAWPGISRRSSYLSQLGLEGLDLEQKVRRGGAA